MCFFLHSSKNTGVGVGVGTLIVLSSPTRFQCTYAIHEPSPFERPAFFNGIIAFYSVPNPSQPHPNPSSRKTGPVFAPGSKARQARPETPRPFSRHRCRFCLWNSLRRRRRSRGCRCLPGKGRRDGGGRGGGEKVSWGSVLSHAPCVCLGPREREIGRQAESRQGLSASPPEKDPARVCVEQQQQQQQQQASLDQRRDVQTSLTSTTSATSTNRGRAAADSLPFRESYTCPQLQ